MRNERIKYHFKKILPGSLFILWAACFFSSCEYEQTPSETIPPVITLNDPDSNDIIMNGDTIRFTGTITDNQGLHSMLLTIEGLQGQLYYTYNPTVEGLTSFSFDTPWLVYGIPYDTIGYLKLLVTDKNENYANELWYMRLRD